MERDLKEDVLALAGFITQIAEAEADLEVPTETAQYAVEQAISIVTDIEGADSIEVAMLNEAHIRITKALEDLVF